MTNEVQIYSYKVCLRLKGREFTSYFNLKAENLHLILKQLPLWIYVNKSKIDFPGLKL